MNCTLVHSPVSAVWLRGDRVSRLKEKYLGRFALDDELKRTLGEEQIGVLVGNCGGLERAVRHLRDLEKNSGDTAWIVIVATSVVSAVVYKMWHWPDDHRRMSPDFVPLRWSASHMIVTTPEGLVGVRPRQLLDEHTDGSKKIGGIILIDTLCEMHRVRTDFAWPRHKKVNRPQVIASFRSAVALEEGPVPLILFTDKQPKGVDSPRVAQAYCLNAFWFVDGATVSCRSVNMTESARLPGDA